MRLTLRPRPTPALEKLGELLRDQLGPLYHQAVEDGPGGLELIELFDVLDARGKHVFDLHLFCGDDGRVHRKGTLDHVASFSQGGATGSKDAALLAALNDAYARVPKQRRAAPAKPQAKGGPLRSSAKGRLQLAKEPTEKELRALRERIAAHGAQTIVEIGPKVSLSVLEHLEGVPFVVMASGRKSFAGLSTLPRSVRRLSIRKHTSPISLSELPASAGIEELELDVPSVSGWAKLSKLRTLGWTHMSDAGAAFVTDQPSLVELALRLSTISRLPPSRSLERLLLFSPSRLTSLVGFEELPALRFLRVDAPKGMKRLGSLAKARSLREITLVRAHAIGDVSDLVSAPSLEAVGVILTQLDETPFLALRGRIKAGSFQLKSPSASKRLFAHLGVPYRAANLIEDRFFDAR